MIRFGITLAALVVEAVSGQSYTDYVKEQILAPLGMENTYLSITEKPRLKTPSRVISPPRKAALPLHPRMAEAILASIPPTARFPVFLTSRL